MSKMKDFDLLCKEFEQMEPEKYITYLTLKSAEIIPILKSTAVDGLSGTIIFFSFVLSAIAADGKLSVDEYNLIYPLLNTFLGDSIDYESAKNVFKSLKRESKDLKNITSKMIDILGLLSENLKEDIIIICMMICAVDGKISFKEKKWIMQLIA